MMFYKNDTQDDRNRQNKTPMSIPEKSAILSQEFYPFLCIPKNHFNETSFSYVIHFMDIHHKMQYFPVLDCHQIVLFEKCDYKGQLQLCIVVCTQLCMLCVTRCIMAIVINMREFVEVCHIVCIKLSVADFFSGNQFSQVHSCDMRIKSEVMH